MNILFCAWPQGCGMAAFLLFNPITALVYCSILRRSVLGMFPTVGYSSRIHWLLPYHNQVLLEKFPRHIFM